MSRTRKTETKTEEYATEATPFFQPIRSSIMSMINSPASTDDIYNDRVSDMTFSRRIARYLARFSFYYPAGKHIKEANVNAENDPEGSKIESFPILDVAWAYFEHMALPRCHDVQAEDGRGKISYQRAEPGERTNGTHLYPLWKTKLMDMGDFGIGVGLYFKTLQFFAVMMLIAGLINIPFMVHLTNNYDGTTTESVRALLRPSMVCPDTSWEPCPTCTSSDWDLGWPEKSKGRFVTFESPVDQSEVHFLKKNNCYLPNFRGAAYASMLFVTLSIFFLSYLQTKEAEKLDEAEQTSSDYSVVVMRPPADTEKDIKDPDTWKTFFEEKFEDAKVDVCTVVLDNEELVNLLMKRKQLVLKLENLLPAGEEFDEKNLESVVERCPQGKWCSADPHKILEEIKVKDSEISEVGTNFPVSSVFITFETEKGQRAVLKKMDVPLLKPDVIKDKYKFEGHTLRVQEPDEPGSIRWKDLDETTLTQVIQQAVTFIVSAALIFGNAALITWAQTRNNSSASITIVILNTITPIIVRILTSFESHRNQTSYSASVYIKITLFRWMNTVIVPLVLTPFAETLEPDQIIDKISTLLVAELVQRPILQLVNLFSTINRHILGPRAPDQRRMNLYFCGSEYNIGERYTDISRIFFLIAFYCTMYPPAFFFASAIFCIYYWIDKFCILRSWKQGPRIGSVISSWSLLVFKFCLFVYAFMAAYTFSQFPYDNACPTDDSLPAEYVGDYGDFSVADGDAVYKYCNQELIGSGAFPPLPSDQNNGSRWMSNQQERFSRIFGWTCIGSLVLLLAAICYRTYMYLIRPLFVKTYKPRGDAMKDKFSKINEIYGYVPQVKIPGYIFPFLLCDVDNLDKGLIGWHDPYNTLFDKHNLIFDIPQLSEFKNEERSSDYKKNLEPFSIVKHYYS